MINNQQDFDRLKKQLTPKMTKFIPFQPHPKQTAFLLLDCREAFFGGAAGPGKSAALLMAALQYVDCPNYSAILFRRTFSELSLAGALMDMAREWLYPFIKSKEVHWSDKNKTYTFKESNATLSFGFLEHSTDKYRYLGAAFQFIGFDELTQMEETDYTYLFSRLRRTTKMQDNNIPLRMRAASNPGGPGHEWTKKRFITDGEKAGRIFIPAVLDDNPSLDKESYIENLKNLSPIEMERLLNGDWEISGGGLIFKREWFEIVPILPQTNNYISRVRYWDLAATDPTVRKGYDPAYTVGLKMCRINGVYYIEDIKRFQKNPNDVEAEILKTAKEDGKGTEIWMEEEPGSSGKKVIEDYKKTLKDFSFRGQKESGSKVLRANKAAADAGHFKIKLVQGFWNTPFLDEIEFFPDSKFKDQVDAFSGAYDKLRNFASYSVIPTAVGAERSSYWTV
jgi:predicted phage terminase large subunit-like protein